MMKDTVAEYDPCDIINMGQSPIPYSCYSSRTLEMTGMKTVHVCASMADTMRVTLTVTVDASGKMLPPMLIFKDMTNGSIPNHEFGTYPDHGYYGCQKKV
jgi:hypothetical protein